MTLSNTLIILFGLILFCIPGFCLGIMILGNKKIQWLEWLPISFVLSFGILSPLAAYGLVRHTTIGFFQLGFAGIMVACVLLLICGLAVNWWQWPFRREKSDSAEPKLNYWLTALFVFMTLLTAWMTFNPRTGGDVWTYGGYVNEYMQGSPMNGEEAFLGTGLPVVPRRAFYVWGVFLAFIGSIAERIQAIDMLKGEFVPMLTLTSILSFYTLARQLFKDSNKAMIAVLIHLIYLTSSGLDASTEIGRAFMARITEDKMVIWTVILPIAIAFAMRYLQNGERRYLLFTLIASSALAFVHPLGMVLFAISFTSYAGLSILFDGDRPFFTKIARFTAIFIITLIFLSVPFIQRQQYADDPRNATYEFYQEDESGELVLDRRMSRERVLVITENYYISDPEFIQYPMIILAIILSPFLFYHIRKSDSARYLLANMLASIILLYGTAPLLGLLITPWQIWRMTWLIPAGLVTAFFVNLWFDHAQSEMGILHRLSTYLRLPQPAQLYAFATPLILIVFAVPFLWLNGFEGLQNQFDRVKGTSILGLPTESARDLVYYFQEHEEFEERQLLLAPTGIARMLPTYIPELTVLEFRGHPEHGGWMMNLSPPDIADAFLARIQSAYRFFEYDLLEADSVTTLEQYQVDYVLLPRIHPLRMQFFALPNAFELLYQNEEYLLYKTNLDQLNSLALEGNTYFTQRNLLESQEEYRKALQIDPKDSLAYLGLSQIHNQLYQNRREKADARKSTNFLLKALENRMDDPSGGAAVLRLYLYEPISDAKVRRNLLYSIIKSYPDVNELLNIEIQQPEVYMDLIDAYKSQKNVDAAIMVGLKGLEYWPDSADINAQLIKMYLSDNRVDAAVAQYKSIIEQFPGQARLHTELGKLYLEIAGVQ